MRRLKLAKFEKGRNDWLVPFKCNSWVQGAMVFYAFAVINLLHAHWGIGFLWGVAGTAAYGAAKFGTGTIQSYRRARHGIKLNPSELDLRLQLLFAGKMYCYRAGVRKAAKDFGVSHTLISALANKWRPY